jgi:flagellar hook-length control protein FliK
MTDVTLLLNQIGVANRGESRGQEGASKQGNGQLFSALMAQQSAAKATSPLKSEQSDTKLNPSSGNSTPNDKTTADRGARTDTVKDTAKDSGSREKVATASKVEKQRDNQTATEREALQPAKNDQPENSSTASQNHPEKSLSDAPQDDQPATTPDQQAIADPSLMNNNLLLLSPFAAANNHVETVPANASSDTVSNSGGVNSAPNPSNPITTTTVANADNSLNLNNNAVFFQSVTEFQNQTEKTFSNARQYNPIATTMDPDPSPVNNNLLLSPFAATNNSVEAIPLSNNGSVGGALNLSNPIAATTVAPTNNSLNALEFHSAAENLNGLLDRTAIQGNLILDNQVVSQAPISRADQLPLSTLQNSLIALQQSDSGAVTTINSQPTATTAATASPNPNSSTSDPLAASTNDFSPALQQATTDSVAPSTDGKINDRFSDHEGKHAGLNKDTEISLTNANPLNVVQSPLIVQSTEVAKQVAMVPQQAGELAQQVTVAIRKGATDGTSQMHIKLNPVELGGIDIRMEVDADHHVRAILTIEKPETYDLLHKDAQHLQKLLGESGLKLADANAIQYEQRSSSLASNTNSNQDWLSSGWFGQEGGQAGRHAHNDSGYTAARHTGGDGDDAASNPVNLITYTHGQIDGRVNIRV